MHHVTQYAPHGMVASVDHLASEAGVAMLRDGGSAADAAIAANAVLTVTAPHMCGMGGDLFALVHDGTGDAPAALNASGRAGSGADAARLRDEGHDQMPFQGDVRAAPVPGCVDGWLALHERYGRLPLARVLEPAIDYAANGFPAGPLLAGMVEQLAGVAGAEDLSAGDRLRQGQRVRRPGVARSMEAIASDGRAGFYSGEFGKGLVDIGAGEYSDSDLEIELAEWVPPLRVRAWDHDVWTIPPNSQGYLTLLGAAIAEGLDLPASDDGLWPHLLVEAARAAAYDRPQRLYENADVSDLFDDAEVARRRALVDPDARVDLASPVGAGDTMYLCAVDDERMGVSLIQSNAKGFGCNVFEPNTGIGLHNRGIGFNLTPGHPAEYAPGRRPPHTLAPALITRPDGTLRAVIGTMGGDAQPQVLLQLLARLLHHRESVGGAVGAPRWSLIGAEGTGFDTWADPDGARVAIETTAPPSWGETLRARGHDVVEIDGVMGSHGHAHVIEIRGDALAGAADHRALISSASGY